MNQDLEILFPSREIIVAGETLHLRPFPFGKLPKVIQLLGNIMHLIVSAEPTQLQTAIVTDEQGNRTLSLGPETVRFMVKLFQEGGENVLELIAIGAGKPREWVDSLEPDQGILLLAAVVEVNWDFFKERLNPVLANLTKKMEGLQTGLR